MGKEFCCNEKHSFRLLTQLMHLMLRTSLNRECLQSNIHTEHKHKHGFIFVYSLNNDILEQMSIHRDKMNLHRTYKPSKYKIGRTGEWGKEVEWKIALGLECVCTQHMDHFP